MRKVAEILEQIVFSDNEKQDDLQKRNQDNSVAKYFHPKSLAKRQLRPNLNTDSEQESISAATLGPDQLISLNLFGIGSLFAQVGRIILFFFNLLFCC